MPRIDQYTPVSVSVATGAAPGAAGIVVLAAGRQASDVGLDEAARRSLSALRDARAELALLVVVTLERRLAGTKLQIARVRERDRAAQHQHLAQARVPCTPRSFGGGGFLGAREQLGEPRAHLGFGEPRDPHTFRQSIACADFLELQYALGSHATLCELLSQLTDVPAHSAARTQLQERAELRRGQRGALLVHPQQQAQDQGRMVRQPDRLAVATVEQAPHLLIEQRRVIALERQRREAPEHGEQA